jgi:hypothetical protein
MELLAMAPSDAWMKVAMTLSIKSRENILMYLLIVDPNKQPARASTRVALFGGVGWVYGLVVRIGVLCLVFVFVLVLRSTGH